MELENKIYLLTGITCSHCEALKPIFYSTVAEEEYEEQVIEKNPKVAIALGIMSVPSIVDNRQGNADTYVGYSACMEFLNEKY